jgi:transposase
MGPAGGNPCPVAGTGLPSGPAGAGRDRGVSRFPTARRLSSYAGLVPSTYASGRAVRHAAIARRSFSFLRWALVETAMYALRSSGPLQEFYRRLLVGKGAQKARGAPARKLTRWSFGCSA